MGELVVERPRPASHRGRVVEGDIGGQIVVVVLPFLHIVVGLVEGDGLLDLAEAVLMPRTGLTDAVARADNTIRHGVAGILHEAEVHEPLDLTAAYGIDATRLGIGVRAIKVAKKHLEIHVVVAAGHREFVASDHPVGSLHRCRAGQHRQHQAEPQCLPAC